MEDRKRKERPHRYASLLDTSPLSVLNMHVGGNARATTEKRRVKYIAKITKKCTATNELQPFM
jgi:hypothetical protein